MNLINIPSSKWTHSFPLPSHYVAGPTVSEPSLDACALRRVAVTNVPLPLHEEFGPNAFGGKCFVRLQRRTAKEVHVSGRVARMRSEQPAFESMWLPDYCILGQNSLSVAAEERRRKPKSAAALRGIGAAVM